MTTAIVLAGHGSHISPETAGIVWKQVDVLRAMGAADEITAAFWKEMPSFSMVFDTLSADDITVVPLFTAQGYFTRMVIPAEMRLTGELTVRDGRTIRYTKTLGEHSHLTTIVSRRIEDTLKTFHLETSETAVALIGHGTPRNRDSRSTTQAQAEKIRALNIAQEVIAVFLDDTPSISDIYNLTTAPNIIAVPYFLASGSHTTIDVPVELGLEAGHTTGEIYGRKVYYTQPVGLDEHLTDIILELARDAGTPLYEPSEGCTWNCFPMVGRDELIQTVRERGEMAFGELRLTPTRVYTSGDNRMRVDDPTTLREFVRNHKRFRPLATSLDLPKGWEVGFDRPEILYAVVETVYPGMVADWALQQTGNFQAKSLDEVIARQVGMFRDLANFERTDEMVKRLCSHCVRYPTWHDKQSRAHEIPCGEPCNWWMSKALKITSPLSTSGEGT